MTPSRDRIVQDVFAEVRKLAPGKRSAYLDTACSDAWVRTEVEKLLESADPSHASAGGVAQQDAPDLSGQLLGPYEVRRPIGRGGMGAVFLAVDTRLGRQVALKVLPAGGAIDPTRVERFRIEARAASSLNHPNIITIYDFGEAEGAPYIVTELVEGRTLREIIEVEETSLSNVVAISTQIAGALAAAHAAGIVHRDIKPENIMVRHDGFVKVLDFGLAKLTETSKPSSAPELTSPGTVIGTARYMSPEQLRGEPLDGRTDLFSLGAVIYELAARQPAFRGATPVDLTAAILNQDPPPLPRQTSSLPSLEPIIRKCLRKDRDNRYQTAPDLLADLRQLQLDMQTVTLPMAPALGRPRRGRYALIAAVVALAALAGAYLWLRPVKNWYQESRLTRIPGSADFSAGALSPDARYIAYVSSQSDGSRSLNLQLLTAPKGIEIVPPALVNYNALAFSADANYLYFVSHPVQPGSSFTLYRTSSLGGQPQRLADNVTGKIAVSPDGSMLAFVRRSRNEGSVSIINADGSSEHELLRRHADYPFQSIAWSPDGSEVIFVETTQVGADADCFIYSMPRRGGSPKQVAHIGNRFIYDLSPLPDGSGYLANAFDRVANLQQIWHISRDGAMRHITHDLNQYQSLSVSRDGRRILTGQVERRSELWIVDFDKPESAHRITDPGRRYDTPTWAHDGNIVASRFESGKWTLWSIQPQGGERPLVAQSGSDLDPATCPDRDEIVFSSARSGSYAIWSVLPDGSGLKQLTSGSNDRLPQCIAGGSVLYWLEIGGSRTAMRVPLTGGQPVPAGTITANQPVSPDGRFVLSPAPDERAHEHRLALRTSDLATTIATFPFSGRTSVLAWAPDGRGFVDERVSGSGQEIWYQPVPSGAARPLTHFGDEQVFNVNWSPDGRRIVCARGRYVGNIVIIDDGN